MGVIKSLSGTVCLELTSADVAGALRYISDTGIPIWAVDIRSDLTVCFRVSRIDLPKIERMAARRGDSLRILSREGIFWSVWALRKRPILLVTVVILISMMLALPGRVLFVSVEGNESVPSRQILEAAEKAGICFGATRRDVRSEKVKNALLGILPQLQWAGVNTYGCTAVISVRERTIPPQPENKHEVSSLVASCDGVIVSCTSTNGTTLCSVGQAVQKGEILISGYVDSGRMITAMRAEGEIFARTQHDLVAKTPSMSLVRGKLVVRKTNFSLLIGKKRINFTKGSGIYDGTCVKMYSEYYLTLPGNFRLPVKLIKETVCEYETLPKQRSADDMAQILSDYTKDYLVSQMISLSIIDAQEVFAEENAVYCLRGNYACIEMIGREQSEEIGDFHGKTN